MTRTLKNTKVALIATDPFESENNAPAAELVVVSGGAEVVFVEGSNVGIVFGVIVLVSISDFDCAVGIPELIIPSSTSVGAPVGAPLASVGTTVGGRVKTISSVGTVLSGHGSKAQLLSGLRGTKVPSEHSFTSSEQAKPPPSSSSSSHGMNSQSREGSLMLPHSLTSSGQRLSSFISSSNNAFSSIVGSGVTNPWIYKDFVNQYQGTYGNERLQQLVFRLQSMKVE